MKRSIPLCVAIFVGCLSSSALTAQNCQTADGNCPTDFRLEFNLSNPGARSLGLGGAFVGLADDATAALANPAGLINLSRPEVSAEGRHWKYTHVYPVRGHAFGPPTGIGADTISGLQNAESSNSVNGLSFLSFVYPHKRWSFALYRHELVNFQADPKSEGPFFDAFGTRDNAIVPFRFLPARIHYDLSIVSYGGSAAFRLNDRWSAGASLAYYDLSLESTTTRYRIANRPPGFFDPANFSATNVDNQLIENGDDTALGGNFGLLWKVTDNWSLGSVYRKGASFTTRRTLHRFVPTESTTSQPDGKLKIPDALAIGTAFRPTDQITVAVEVNRVLYSDIFKNEATVKIDDANEVHFGVEYVVLPKSSPSHPISFRLGAWLDPDHQPVFQGLPDDSADQRRLAVLFQPGSDEWHYSGGLGFVFGARFQVDAAVDLSNRIDTFSLSAVYRF